MLRFEDVTFENGDFRLTADFSVQAGRKVAVIGPSGAGKSTLVNGLAGFHDAAQGRVLWRDQDITGLSPGLRPVSILFQDGNLFPHLTIRQNAGLGLRPDLKLTEAQWQQVDAALAETGLADLGGRKPAELSGGQQSRAALARVLLKGRPLLLLDEPFAALGPALRTEMLDLVQRLVASKGLTLLMVSHAPEDARRIADEVILIEGGRAHPPAPTAEMFENPPPALRAYLG